LRVVAAVLVGLVWSPPCAIAQTANLSERARESIVYIFFEIVDSQTGAKARVLGTGFIVSPSGYVLTASHLFRSWREQTDASKAANQIKGTRYDKPSYIKESPLILEPISLGDGDAEDVALLKLPHLGGLSGGERPRPDRRQSHGIRLPGGPELPADPRHVKPFKESRPRSQ
jgi:hypothetical protein